MSEAIVIKESAKESGAGQVQKNRLSVTLTKLILTQFGEFWPYYLAALVCLFGLHYTQSWLPFFAQDMAEIITSGTGEVATWQLFLAAIGIILFRTASRLLFFYPARVLQKFLRIEITARLEDTSPTRYRHYPAGQLYQIISNDMDQLRALIGFALLQVGNIVVAMMVLIPRLSKFDPRLIPALLPMVGTFVIFTLITSNNRKYYRKTQDLQGEVQNFIMESYTGKKTIKNYQAEAPFIDLFKKHSMAELINFYKAGVGVSFSIPLIILGVNLSLAWGAYVIRMGDLGASALVLFTGFVFLFLEPLAFLSWIGLVFASSAASWKRIKGLVNALEKESQSEIRLSELNQGLDSETYQVEFWNQPLKLDIKKSKWTCLAGKTGCGKSTILTQIAMIAKERGVKLSYVAQEPYLYNDKVLDNIFLGREVTEKSKARAYELLKLFGLDYLASNVDSLLNMEVGENGKRLSGGQAKRLALVRSLMSDADLLVWDDPFSSVDVILERQIVRELKSLPELKERTLVCTSHRLTTVRFTDELYLLQEKEGVCEAGRVSELLVKGTRTYEHFQDQMV